MLLQASPVGGATTLSIHQEFSTILLGELREGSTHTQTLVCKGMNLSSCSQLHQTWMHRPTRSKPCLSLGVHSSSSGPVGGRLLSTTGYLLSTATSAILCGCIGVRSMLILLGGHGLAREVIGLVVHRLATDLQLPEIIKLCCCRNQSCLMVLVVQE